jgi:hypothetical protein
MVEATPGLARNNSFGPMGLEVCQTGFVELQFLEHLQK